MEYKLKTYTQGHIYLPYAVRETFGKELRFIPNSEAGVIYPKDTDLNRVIESLKIIIADLKLRAKPKLGIIKGAILTKT